jgi:GDP-4-dehydro-6-deoxy-D-mannose reductase
MILSLSKHQIRSLCVLLSWLILYLRKIAVRILITGISGFVGRHLVRHLLDTTPNTELHGTTLQQPAAHALPHVVYHTLDLRDVAAVYDLLAKVQPEQIYHLAAQAFVPRSFEDPWDTLENNIRSQLNLILACLQLGIKPRMLVVGSAEAYGMVKPEDIPIREDTPLCPSSPYSVSKVTQDMMGLQYFISHQLPIIRVRPFNHTGPWQDERFVVPAFAMQIARIESGAQDPVVKVGDLSAERDFTDVRDVVRAYRLILERGTIGEVYNIASGKSHSIRSILDRLCSYSSVPITVEIDPARIRPTAIPVLRGDITKIQTQIGWQPEITLDQMLNDVLIDCRQRIKES